VGQPCVVLVGTLLIGKVNIAFEQKPFGEQTSVLTGNFNIPNIIL